MPFVRSFQPLFNPPSLNLDDFIFSGIHSEKKMGEDCGDCSSKWEQEMYWTRFQSIMFFQVLPQGFDQQLDIPQKFASNMKKKLPENVTVVGPSGAKWNVGLVASGDTLLFKQGWKEFVEHHSLKEDDVLIFKYNGDSQFDVLTFDGWSLCERESSYFVRKCGHTGLDVGLQTERNTGECPVEVGACSRSKRPRNNKNLRSAGLGRHIQARTRGRAKRGVAQRVNSGLGRHIQARTRGRAKCGVAQKVNSASEGGFLGSYVLQYASTRRPVTEEEKENARKMALAASTPNSCIVVMRATYVYRRFIMLIPSEWALSHLPRKAQDVTLRVIGNEKTWHAKYNGKFDGSIRVLSGGWKDFVFENNLEESDVCLFEPASGTHSGIVMDVRIFRVVAEVTALTRLSRSAPKRGRR